MGFFASMRRRAPVRSAQYVRPREWHQPGDNVVPASVAVEDGLLVRGDAVAAYLSGVAVYPYGFEFGVTALRRRVGGRLVDARAEDPFGMGIVGRGERAGSERLLRFGVRFADGRGAAPDAGAWQFSRDAEPEAPVMTWRGGRGGQGKWAQRYWVWGLPAEGDVSLVYSWLAESVGESSFVLDGDALRSAASRAVVLWEETEMH